tara:strand:+ start:569 stop:1456 length:888 start_codon:yes stop_codon:yes gene_type:complete
MGNEIVESSNEGIAGLNQTELVQIANQAGQRIDAMSKIKNTAIKLTNEGDWVDQGGRPYLQSSGAEKMASAFGISWSFVTAEPSYEEDDEGHYTYTYHGRFTMANRAIEIDGSRSSRDPFFKQYDYPNGTKTEKGVHERTNKRDVKMSALTNLLGNGITRMLGIRNMTYADLKEFANIKKEDLGRVSYDSVKKTRSRTSTDTPDKEMSPEEEIEGEVITKIERVSQKNSKPDAKKQWTKYIIHSLGGPQFHTFDKNWAEVAAAARDNERECLILFKYNAKYKCNEVLTVSEVPEE